MQKFFYLILTATLKKILKLYITQFCFILYALHLMTINKRRKRITT